MATHQLLVATLLVLLLSKGDKGSTEAKEVTMHGRQVEDRCVCTFVSPYVAADYSQPQQSRRPDCTDSILDSEFIKQELHFMRRHQIANRKQTLRQGDQIHNLTSRMYEFKDALNDNERVQRSWDMRLLSATAETRELQRLVSRQRDTIGFLRQRVDAMFEEMLKMRELNQRLMFEMQDQADKSEDYRTKVDTLVTRVDNIDLNMNEFMFAFAGMKRMAPSGETASPTFAEEPMEKPEVKEEARVHGSGDIVFDDVDYDIVPNPRRRRETDQP